VHDLICRAVSGKFFREEGRNSLFRELIDANAALLGGFNLDDYFPRLARVQLLSKVICAKARKSRKRWDKLLDGLIDDHAAMRRGRAPPPRTTTATSSSPCSPGNTSTASPGTISKPSW